MDSEVVERLGKFKLSDKKEIDVEINLSDTRNIKEACERSLVERVFGGNVVNFTGLSKQCQNCGVQQGS